jgi:ATP-dependent protease ClpP protease subunit
LSATIYATLASHVDQSMVQRVFQTSAIAINVGVKTIHLLFHSSGGRVADGVVLYNYFRNLPIELHIYNEGSVSSIGVIAFLGAHNRYASANATFMIQARSVACQDNARDAALAGQLMEATWIRAVFGITHDTRHRRTQPTKE